MTDAPDLASPSPAPMHRDAASAEHERAAHVAVHAAAHREPPRRLAVAAAMAGALGTDLAMWTTGPGLAWTVGATIAAGAVLVGARPRRRAALALLAIVPMLAVWCCVRTSPWLIGPDVVAVNLCLILGADLAGRGSWFDQSLARMVVRIVLFAEDAWNALPWIRPAVHRSPAPDRARRDWAPVVGGLAIGIPLVAVLAGLLASADAVFASFFDLDLGIDGSVVARHVIFVACGALAVTTLLRKASATSEVVFAAPTRLSATVGNIVMVGVAAVFALYAASRMLALTGTAERIATTRGLTWAEYARSGFFQLLAVAAITLVVLLTVCGWCDRGNASQTRLRKVLGLVIVAEILGIVIDAVHRLAGYQEAYGLTMLRLYSTGFAIWIAIVFVIVGIAVATDYRGLRWLTPTILSTALVSLVVLNVVNPERIVAERNLTGPTRAVETDLTYLLAELGDDALPTISHHLGTLDDLERAELRDSLCFDPRPTGEWFNPNRARGEADRLVERWCGSEA